jgi:dihydropteroate synthase
VGKKELVSLRNARVVIIDNLAQARAQVREVGASLAGIESMAPKAIQYAIKLGGVSSPAANILKQEMLAIGGEAAIAKGVIGLKAKISDVLLMGTLKEFDRLIEKLAAQPFGLNEIAQELKELLGNLIQKGFWELKCGKYRFSLGRRTLIMGILNVTPDSFADGGLYNDLNSAILHAKNMASQGADIIDVGGESTRPGAKPVSLKEELHRVIPVIKALLEEVDLPISIDTYRSEVAQKALDLGAHMVNDISALRMDPEMASLVASYNVPLVLLHMQGRPRNMQRNPRYECVVGEILDFLRERIRAAVDRGIDEANIIVDPGIGFGKLASHNLQIVKRLWEFKSLGRPILLGPSRKRVIGDVLGLPVEERLEGTAALVSCAILNGANIVRVHDVKEMVRVARMADAIKNAP